jgi:hypothetical protein
VENSCESGNQPSGSIKCWEVAKRLAASQKGLSSMDLFQVKVKGEISHVLN